MLMEKRRLKIIRIQPQNSKRLVFALKLQVEVNINVKPTGVQNWMPSENGSWLSQHFELLPHINDPSAR